MRIRLLGTLLFVVAATPAMSQTPAADSVPRGGEWGAELGLGTSSLGATLLRFTSSRTALLLGASVDYSHTSIEGDAGNPFAVDGNRTQIGLRAGLRRYRTSSVDALRPVIGAGLVAAYGELPNDASSRSIGGYGELGAVYFVAPHLSLGATGQLRVEYERATQPAAVGGEITTKTTGLSGSLVQLLVAVYF